jgi:hypothetical protein
MPNYFARVELHDAEWPDDYKKLHKLLADVGFTQCVRYTKGGSGKLPTGADSVRLATNRYLPLNDKKK